MCERERIDSSLSSFFLVCVLSPVYFFHHLFVPVCGGLCFLRQYKSFIT